MSVQIKMRDPLQYNPNSIFGIDKNYESTQLKLLVKSRYCNLSIDKGMAYFYLELTDNVNEYIIPCKYYEFLAAAEADYVYCTYMKLKQGKDTLNVLEISRIPKTHVNIEEYNKDEKINPLSNNNSILPKEYIILNRELPTITRVLQKQSDLLYVGLATLNLEDGRYTTAMCSIQKLLSTDRVGVQYRQININGKRILVDMEVYSL
jgi:hypothetical protein